MNLYKWWRSNWKSKAVTLVLEGIKMELGGDIPQLGNWLIKTLKKKTKRYNALMEETWKKEESLQ
jgi:hypothetical protein